MSTTYIKTPGTPLAEVLEVECPTLLTFFGGGVAKITLGGVVIGKLSASSPTKELKYPGTYKLSMPIGHCRDDSATISIHPIACTPATEPFATPTPTLVCIKLKTDPMEVPNVINAWACVACGGDSLTIKLFGVNDGVLITNPDDYEIL